MILRAEELGAENAGARYAAEDAQIENEYELVGDGDASVPSWPTMMLSSMLTKLVMPFWIIIGTATISTIL